MKYPHWHYFVSLCDDLERVSRYVEISPENYPTHSTEFSRIYLAAGSEIDVVAKLLCKSIQPAAKPSNIDAYRDVILGKYPHFHSIEVDLPKHGLSYIAWKQWAKGKNPHWWRAYNDVKHERDKFYRAANLENTLHSVAALLVMVGYLHIVEISESTLPQPELMRFGKDYHSGGATKMERSYMLPGIQLSQLPAHRSHSMQYFKRKHPERYGGA